MSADMEERVSRLDTMIAEGRVIREQWTDGHERACLLAALSPEAGKAEQASACPAHVMPEWLAYMTPWIDDEVSDDAWPGVIRRYAALARRWSALDDAAWERARVASLIAIVSEARAHCPPAEERALSAIDGVIAWLRFGAPKPERVAVRDSAWAAWSVAAACAARAASRAAWASVSEETRAAVAAASAASAAEAASSAVAAAVAASAVEATRAAASDRLATAGDTSAAASDRIATAVLDAIEAEIESAYGEEEEEP